MAGRTSRLKSCSSFLFHFIFLVLLLQSSGQEIEDEREFSYEVGSENGPENWGKIHEEWALCGSGKLQSPIDLKHERVQASNDLGPLRRTYRDAPATLMNRGHDIMLKFEEEAGGLWINGTKYMIKQIHWHSPSEHTVNGRRYILEVHMVHESADKNLAVVGILYTAGQPDSFIAQMEEYIKKLADMEGAEEKVGLVNPWNVKWGSRKYIRYIGSLTTPPCTEGVTWNIIDKVRTASKAQVRLLRDAVQDKYEDNARPTQPDNNRDIFTYRPHHHNYS